MLAGVAITVSGCGSTSSPAAPTPTPTSSTPGTNDVSGVISGNHGHSAVVTGAQITAANAVSLNIQGVATHNHVVALTADQVMTIGARNRVSVQSTTVDGHQHTVTFN